MNYANIQSYSFIQTGFERINRLTAWDNLDTLSYTQLSQNAAMNVTYDIGKTEKKAQAPAFVQLEDKISIPIWCD